MPVRQAASSQFGAWAAPCISVCRATINSLNIQGVFRRLPLFDPPLDPALLARAASAGLDVGAVVNGLNQPLPLVRFQLLVQKAAEICQEVKSLGNNLLSAMEKEDGEALAILR